MMLKTRIMLLLTVLILIAGCSKTSDWEKATRYYEAGKYKSAIKYFTKVREDTPSRENSADYMIGECYFKLEEYTKAKEAFKRIIVPQQTDNLVKLYMKALWEFNGGFHDKALPFLEIIVQTNPTFKEGNAFFYFIRATKTVHGVEKAMEKARMGIELFPGNIEEKGMLNLYNLYGTMLMEAEKWAQAEEYLKKALPLKDDFLIRYNLGIVYEKTNRIEDAKVQYFQAFVLGDMDEARWKYFKYMSLEEIGDNLELLKFSADGYNTFKTAVGMFDAGRFEMFRYWIQKGLEKDLNVEKLLYQWGDRLLSISKSDLEKANVYHYVKGDGESAEKLYRSIENPGVHADLNFGILLVKAGNFEKSEQYLSKAAVASEDNIVLSRSCFYRGLSRLNQNNIKGALERFLEAEKKDHSIMTLGFFQGILTGIRKGDIKDGDAIIDMLLKHSRDKEIKKWIGQNLKG